MKRIMSIFALTLVFAMSVGARAPFRLMQGGPSGSIGNDKPEQCQKKHREKGKHCHVGHPGPGNDD